MTSTGEKRRSVAIAVAPNGARRTREEHPGVPLAPREIAYAAAAAAEAGAAMIHLHIRTPQGEHTLDPGIYGEALSELRREVRNRMIVQITTDSLGKFRPRDQMAVVREVRPEAVSLALRELCPDAASEAEFAEFLKFVKRERIAPQFILYDANDVVRYALLVDREIIPWRNAPVIFVLGRYQLETEPQPHDLLPLFEAAKPVETFATFMTCAFSPAEASCGIAGALLGGDIRVGFENNILLPDGRLAPDNVALVRAVVEPLSGLSLVPEDVDAMRERYLV
ncbi:MAG: 3-keto-5-aminohexanoate cleavage protein [Bauldia sp.]|nr:3-keto-5-aminohexanoate cleavage protein [Bauldia sp.]MCW5718919.1 3-keto-5-aminohexanoate cleavage protein [Bauldia sp.]